MKKKNRHTANSPTRANRAIPTADPTQLLRQALALHQQGQLPQAQTLYRQVLVHEPHNVNALNFLGLLLHQAGDSPSALALLSQASELQPGHAPIWNNRGLVLRKLGRYADAAASYERALAIKADYTEAWINFANVLRNMARAQDAVQACQRALALQPDSVHALNTLGAALNDGGKPEDALVACQRAIALAPGFANAHFNAAVAFSALSRYDEALQNYALALQYDPYHAIAWNNRGVLLDELRRPDEAIVCYNQALQIDPDYVEAHINKGTALEGSSQFGAALACFDQAIAIAPDHLDAHASRGHCLCSLQRYADAAMAFATVVQQDPFHPFVRGHLFDAWSRAADWSQLPFLMADLIADVQAGRPSAMPFGFLAVQDNAQDQLRCAQTYMAHQVPEPIKPVYQGEAYSHERLRVAYLSADFHDHATMHLMAEVFEAHNPERFEISALSFGPNRVDAMRERMQRYVQNFVDVTRYSDLQVAQWMRDHHIDIAVDLKGHTQDSRPGIFALRGAPVQVNFLGYPGSLGAPYWD